MSALPSRDDLDAVGDCLTAMLRGLAYQLFPDLPADLDDEALFTAAYDALPPQEG
jgi:hypothetical protein